MVKEDKRRIGDVSKRDRRDHGMTNLCNKTNWLDISQ